MNRTDIIRSVSLAIADILEHLFDDPETAQATRDATETLASKCEKDDELYTKTLSTFLSASREIAPKNEHLFILWMMCYRELNQINPERYPL